MTATEETHLEDSAMHQAICQDGTTFTEADNHTKSIYYLFYDDGMSWLKSFCPSTGSKPSS
jgi:hypothetical protein